MVLNESKKHDDLVEAIASIVLQEGLDALALRGLADRLSTSGRMLLYYFGNKDAMIRAVLARISERMAPLQDAASSGDRVSAGQFLSTMMQAGANPEIAPIMRVWTDVVARAARGETPYREIADRIVVEWIDWINSRLLPDPDHHAEARDARAEAILSIMEGVTILEMARPGTTDGARRLLPALLDHTPTKDMRVRRRT
jgi:AcrR family transcriptional regulator